MTRAYLYSPSCPNGIAFLNTVLLFVNNHGNCKMICLCVHIHQNGHHDSSTFKVMIEKLTVTSGPSRSGSVTILRDGPDFYMQNSCPSQAKSGPSRFVRSVTAIFVLINV